MPSCGRSRVSTSWPSKGSVTRFKCTVCLMLLAVGLTANAAPQADDPDANVLVVRGVLTRSGLAGTLWRVKPEQATKFRDADVLEVTFATRPGAASRIYGPFEERFVELIGEVKEVFNGNATLARLRSIGVVDSPLDPFRYMQPPLAAAGAATTVAPSVQRVPYKHAYYLFLAGTPKNCEQCYVPLLISQSSFEDTARGTDPVLCVYVSTYERNSIWQMRGAVPVEPSAIEAAARIVHVNGTTYRYQEVTAKEVVGLLEKPMGTIPISRPMMTNNQVPEATIEELLRDFRAVQAREE